ncbi:NAD-dependent epimerase/dehydratase family protein [Lyngbya aestuarii]|uniref:NAD-dependent epimerase/dehydratase family protein n=1 Tax=Lyngbya aestuarii TaxID=118322 RepID=UPI00403D8339
MDINDKTLLITGIGNYVGLRAAEIALERGIKVKGLEPLPEAAKKAEALGIEVVVGSTSDAAQLDQVCQNIDIVFHTESMVDPAGPIEPFRRVNVDGAINAVKAAKQAGVKTFLHLSTVMVYGFKFPDQITEDGPLRGEKNPLCQTKIESEQEVLKFNAPPDFGVIIIRPGDIYGPGASSWILEPLQLMRQKVFALANGGKGIINHVYIDNLIDGVFLAAEQERYGEAFNITDGGKTTWKQFFYRLAEIAGEPQPASMPAMALKTAAKLQGKQLGIFPESIDFVTRCHTYSIEKARRVLGYQPKILLDEGMAKTATWLRKNDLLKPIPTGGAKTL